MPRIMRMAESISKGGIVGEYEMKELADDYLKLYRQLPYAQVAARAGTNG